MDILGMGERPSGSTIEKVVMKTGPGMRDQGIFMKTHTSFLQPLRILDDGYIMPLAHNIVHFNYRVELEDVLRLLSGLWATRPVGGGMPMAEYRNYIKSVAPHHIQELLEKLWDDFMLGMGTPAGRIHGDVTTDNLVILYDKLLLIDPNLRPVPQIIEMDTSKLLLNKLGWGPKIQGLEMLPGEKEPFMRWLALAHIARMWRYQGQHRLLLGMMANLIAG